MKIKDLINEETILSMYKIANKKKRKRAIKEVKD